MPCGFYEFFLPLLLPIFLLMFSECLASVLQVSPRQTTKDIYNDSLINSALQSLVFRVWAWGDLDFSCNLYQTNFAITLRAEWDQSKNIRKYFFHIEYDFFLLGIFWISVNLWLFFQEFYYSQEFWSKSLPWITPNYTHLQNNFSWRRTVNWLIIFCTTEDKMTTRTARETETW